MNPINRSGGESIEEIFEARLIFKIPLFQRNFTWDNSNLRTFQNALMNVADGKVDCYLLHQIFFVKREMKGSLDILEIGDGQQRLTTVYLFLASLVKWFAKNGEEELASKIFGKYIIYHQPLDENYESNFRLHSNLEDRRQINSIVNDLLEIKCIKHDYAYLDIKTFNNIGKLTGKLTTTYNNSFKFINNTFKIKKDQDLNGVKYIEDIYEGLVKNTFIVMTELNSSDILTQVYDAINSGQKPVTIGELLKNFIFSKIKNCTDKKFKQLHDEIWKPFESKFIIGKKNHLDKFLYLYAATLDPRIKKDNSYEIIRDSFVKFDNPEKILSHIDRYANIYLALKGGVIDLETPEAIKSKVHDLHMLHLPDAASTFVFKLINASYGKSLGVNNILEMLKYIECFFIRRSICGLDTTGLSTMFRGMWFKTESKPSLTKIKEIIDSSLYRYPTDHEIRNSLENRIPNRTHNVQYIMLKYDHHLGGDSMIIPKIERIMPIIKTDLWGRDYNINEYRFYANQIGNLIPVVKAFKDPMMPIHSKVKRYNNDPIYKSPKIFKHKIWGKKEIKKRTQDITKFLIEYLRIK